MRDLDDEQEVRLDDCACRFAIARRHPALGEKPLGLAIEPPFVFQRLHVSSEAIVASHGCSTEQTLRHAETSVTTRNEHSGVGLPDTPVDEPNGFIAKSAQVVPARSLLKGGREVTTMEIQLLLGLLLPFICTLTIATIRSRRRQADEGVVIISTIQGAA